MVSVKKIHCFGINLKTLKKFNSNREYVSFFLYYFSLSKVISTWLSIQLAKNCVSISPPASLLAISEQLLQAVELYTDSNWKREEAHVRTFLQFWLSPYSLLFCRNLPKLWNNTLHSLHVNLGYMLKNTKPQHWKFLLAFYLFNFIYQNQKPPSKINIFNWGMVSGRFTTLKSVVFGFLSQKFSEPCFASSYQWLHLQERNVLIAIRGPVRTGQIRPNQQIKPKEENGGIHSPSIKISRKDKI